MLSINGRFDRLILGLVLAFEALLCSSFYSREIARYPPSGFDQATFLTEAYHLEENIISHGLGAVWKAVTSKGHPNGLLLPVEGALSGLVIGGARWPQLAVNFVFFGALQIFAFYTACKMWGHRVYGYAVVGFILCQATAWFQWGGLFDFRMDFSAYCLYGIWCCAVIRSKLFLDRRWAIGCGLIGAFLVLNRFLTVVYLLGVGAGFAGVCVAVGFLQRANVDLASRMRQRLYHLGLSTVLLAIIVVPILIINRVAIHDYYFIGHAVGPEKNIRAQDAGLTNLTEHLSYYPRSILFDHWSNTFYRAAVIAFAGAFVSRLVGRRDRVERNDASQHVETFPLEIIFLVAAILVPVVVLTTDIAKSPVVGGITGVPAALLLLALAAQVAVLPRGSEISPAQKLMFLSLLLVFALGLFNQFGHANRHLHDYTQRRDLQRLAEMDKSLADYAGKHGWRNPTISFDVISEWFIAGTITTTGYEQTNELIEFRPMLGNSIMGIAKSDAISLLAHSDLFILTTLQKVGVYPFYEQLAQYWNDLKAWADQNMILIRTIPFDSYTATVYSRPSATISGLSRGWITQDGLLVEAPRVALQRFPEVRLSGIGDYLRLTKVPNVAATIDAKAGNQSVPASFRRIDNAYDIVIDTSSVELPASENIIIRLHFDTFFVSNNVSPNDGTWKLVVPAPTFVQLMRPGS
jgi:hypothetical protein